MAYNLIYSSNSAEVKAELMGVEPQVKQAIIQGVDDTARQVEMAEKSKVRKKSHNLMNSIVRLRTGEMSQTVMPTKPYAEVIEKGRGAVYPVLKKALWWPGLAHPIPMAKAFKGDPFVRPAFELATMTLYPNINRNVARVLR
jgi:hypothetical protein